MDGARWKHMAALNQPMVKNVNNNKLVPWIGDTKIATYV